MNFTLYTADVTGSAKNCRYPHRAEVTDEQSLKEAVSRDHVMAEYKGNYRSNDNFIRSNVIPMDVDNDHSDDPADWKTKEDVKAAFPGVSVAFVPSRNNMKEKDGKAARPKFHVFFPCDEVTDAEKYAQMKTQLKAVFPAFDDNALDAARFMFGVPDAEVEICDGSRNITQFLAEQEPEDAFANMEGPKDEIQQGSRNNTLSRFAGRLLIRLGDTEEARQAFREEAEKCNPPLSDKEMNTIWNSAVKFSKKVASKDGYIPPDMYRGSAPLKPDDFTDVGQAVVLAREYGVTKLLYSPATDFLVYNGSYFEESKPAAQAVEQELTTRQIEESRAEKKKWMEEMKKNGALAAMMAKQPLNAVQEKSLAAYNAAEAYEKFALKMQDTRKITAAQKEVRPMVLVDHKRLDSNEFLLNTPGGTYDLRTGERRDHNPADLLTKQTAADPGDKGKDIWDEALDTFFLGDKELMGYVQRMVGLAAIGKVFVEALLIAYGEGRNGKSTFWNTISRCLGSYSGSISADTLTAGCRRNVKPELAEARGKRLLIAAELEEGVRLSTSIVKQLASTDPVSAEKKYKDPFKYVPTHTLVLYTNHLPKVTALDQGTWRRLIVIPFNAVIEGKSDIKNYADYLFNHAAEAIMAWIIEGARLVIEDDFKVKTPKVVQDAIDSYREANNWLDHYLTERCVLGDGLKEKSGDLYTDYSNYCLQTGEYKRSTTDFYSALEGMGLVKVRTNSGRFIKGVQLKSDFDDFLQ